MEEEPSHSLASLLVPVFTIGLVVMVQVNFWWASAADVPTTAKEVESTVDANSNNNESKQPESLSEQNAAASATKERNGADANHSMDDATIQFEGSNQWRCVCEEGSFLPPALLKTFGPAEAMVRLGTGQCYHKQM